MFKNQFNFVTAVVGYFGGFPLILFFVCFVLIECLINLSTQPQTKKTVSLTYKHN